MNVFAPNGTSAGSSDEATSPEAVAITNNVVPGIYQVQVCPSPAPLGPFVAPFTYTGTFTTGDAAAPSGVPYPPKWKIFHNFPPTYAATDNRNTDCWQNQTGFPPATVPGCTGRELTNLAARAPFDVDPHSGLPTFTTIGNAAVTGEAWLSPLTPAEQYRPVSNARDYSFPFQDQWRTSKCNPGNFVAPQRNDIDDGRHQPVRRSQPIPRLFPTTSVSPRRTTTRNCRTSGIWPRAAFRRTAAKVTRSSATSRRAR